jgi:hypothetical protein
MDYKAFTNGSLSLMYEAVRAALGSDDAQERQGEETFQLSLPFLTTIDRQIASAQKQLMAFLKEIDRRESRRAHASAGRP